MVGKEYSRLLSSHGKTKQDLCLDGAAIVLVSFENFKREPNLSDSGLREVALHDDIEWFQFILHFLGGL